ncbi:MAG: tyrosine-type recombinase/integrase [Prevotellaceae bacterium]|jgi:integrase|nr:tyrosine-type recombinase/integrase [Prevotellaceae bacterium]
MRRKKFLIYPHLCDRKGDLSKQWYVELSMRNVKTGELLRKRFEEYAGKSINQFNTDEERRTFATKIIEQLNMKIANGWTIFDPEPGIVYEDQLQNGTSARLFKKLVNSNMNFKYWISRYIVEELQGSFDEKGETLRTYRSRYRVFEAWLEHEKLNKLDVSEIDNGIILRFFTHLKTERKLCSRTYNSYGQLLSDFFKYAMKHGAAYLNPVHDLPKNKTVRDLGAERISQSDMKRLMEIIDEQDAQLGFACRFQYYCGMRPGYEIRWLKTGDINFKRGTIKISSEISKTDRYRDIAVPDVFMKYIIENWHLDVFDANLYVFGNKGMPGKNPYGKNSFRNRFNQIRDKLKLPKYYKFYSFKHTGAVTLAEQGESIINIRDHLGHTSIETTEHYLKRHGFNDSEIIRKKFPEI